MTLLDATLILLFLSLLPLFLWLFRHLARERWQFVAAIPLYKLGNGRWRGLNLTMYGLLTALAAFVAGGAFIFLAGAAGTPAAVAILLLAGILAICLPAARVIARVVEGNPHGFTVGGASFLGILLAPAMLWGASSAATELGLGRISWAPLLAALAIAYVLGEGLGRLACVSFGCCYGKPLERAPRWWRQACGGVQHSFEGRLRKIAFAANLEGVPVIPVQPMSCLVLTGLGLVGTGFFFHGMFGWAFLLPLVGSQAWRLGSEMLRADHRGNTGTFSAYQLMAVLASLYGAGLAMMMSANPGMVPHPAMGAQTVWEPGVVLSLQALALAVFVFTGTSTVTRSEIGFELAPGLDGATLPGTQPEQPRA